jgi:hypothetical protein
VTVLPVPLLPFWSIGAGVGAVGAGLDDAVAVGVGVDGDGHIADAGLAGVLHAVAVGVDPDAIAQRRVAGAVDDVGGRVVVVAEVGGEVFLAGAQAHRVAGEAGVGDGHRGVVLVAEVGARKRARRRLRHAAGQGARLPAGAVLHINVVVARRQVVEQVAAVGVGERARHLKPVGVVEHDDDVGQARLAGVLKAVAVLVDPDVVADGAKPKSSVALTLLSGSTPG